MSTDRETATISAATPTQRAGSGAVSSSADGARDAFVAWRDGDAAAFDRLIRLLTPVLWHLARSYRLDQAAAEDAVQNTWLALVRRRDEVREPQAVLRWLSVTVRREAARLARTADRATPVEDEVIAAVVEPTPGADTEAIERDTNATLWRHVGELSERCQRLLRVLAFSDRPDYRALSVELGMPVGSIGPTRSRCLEKLRAACAADRGWGLT